METPVDEPRDDFNSDPESEEESELSVESEESEWERPDDRSRARASAEPAQVLGAMIAAAQHAGVWQRRFLWMVLLYAVYLLLSLSWARPQPVLTLPPSPAVATPIASDPVLASSLASRAISAEVLWGSAGAVLLVGGGSLRPRWLLRVARHRVSSALHDCTARRCRRSPRRYYRCVSTAPHTITAEAAVASVAGGTTAALSDGHFTPVGVLMPQEVAEVREFQLVGSTGQLRARVRNGWVDVVDASRGVPLLQDLFSHAAERFAVALRPSDWATKRAESALHACISSVDSPRKHLEEQELRATVAEFGRGIALESSGLRALCVRAIPRRAERPLENAAATAGAVVVCDRGRVPFVTKARHAQNAGAAGVILINDTDEPLAAHGHTNPDGTADNGLDVTIPVLCVRKSAGEILTTVLPATVELRLAQPSIAANEAYL